MNCRKRLTLDFGTAVPIAFARLASSSALKSVAFRSTCMGTPSEAVTNRAYHRPPCSSLRKYADH